MIKKKKCVAMLLAGGQGSRLSPLTRNTAKPAVQFASRYRIIDFSLSNCVNSGIDTVGVLTQYQPLELNDYLGNGSPWGLDLRFGGLHVLPPYQAEEGADWFLGTANAIYQNLAFIRQYDPDYVLILSGDHIYKMNYAIMLDEHIANKADLTVAVIDVAAEEASRFGIMNTDEDGRIIEFEEKPAHPKSTQASMGVYIFSKDAMVKYLTADAQDPGSAHDFGKNIIPAMLEDDQRVFSYLYKGYWRDVGTLQSFWQSNMDTISQPPLLKLHDPKWRIYYRHFHNRPQYISATGSVRGSICGDCNEILGSIRSSVIFDNTLVEEGAQISGSIVMNDCLIKKNARIHNAILDNQVVVEEGAVVGAEGEDVPLTVIDRGVVIPAGTTVRPGSTVLKQ